ncbi:MAG: AraC family transcriptional regulator [Halioglobus sp.]
MTQYDTPTTIASYVQAFASALEARGIDPQAVFADAQISIMPTSDPLKRISEAEVGRLFQSAIRATHDPSFGIAVGECMQPSNLHAIGFGLMSSSTLRDFYQRICNYYRVVSQSADFHSYDADGAAVLAATNLASTVCYETRDAWVTMMVRFIRFLYQLEINPLWIELSRPPPEGGGQAYLDYFHCPVRFGCAEDRIAMDASVMDRLLPGASPDMAQHNDQIVMEYLDKIDRKDIVNRVRGHIIEELASGTLTKQGVADKMHMSPRNLQLKLAARDTTFQDTLDSTRQNLATGYMEQSHLAITEIAYLLGFSDASNFTRAFRRWFGVSPREYRAASNMSQDY